MAFRLKRVYDEPGPEDGLRVLVDRLWPRGLSKSQSRVDLWLKEIAPSPELRKKFCHRLEKWTEFRRLYFEELRQKTELVNELRKKAQEGPITLLFAARDKEKNNAVVLLEFLEGSSEPKA